MLMMGLWTHERTIYSLDELVAQTAVIQCMVIQLLYRHQIIVNAM